MRVSERSISLSSMTMDFNAELAKGHLTFLTGLSVPP